MSVRFFLNNFEKDENLVFNNVKDLEISFIV